MLPCKKRKITEPQNVQPNTKFLWKEELPVSERELVQSQTSKLCPDRTEKQSVLRSVAETSLTAQQEQAHELDHTRNNLNSGSYDGTSDLKQAVLPYDNPSTLGGIPELSVMIAEEKKLDCDQHRGPHPARESETQADGNAGKTPNLLNSEGQSTESGKDPLAYTCQSPTQQVVPVRRSLQLGDPPPLGRKCPSTAEYPASDEDDEFSEMVITLEEDEDSSPDKRKKRRKRPVAKRKREGNVEGTASVNCDFELDDVLEFALEDRAKLHNLTATNVRNILHEVITNEHVVAMMKAAINETEEVPMFEPKMTRSKLKEVVEKGVVIPSWNLSPVKKAREIKPIPQFVDIPLADEDSSDEEYQPDEDEEDETAEESFLESDVESTASSPRVPKRFKTCRTSELQETDEEMAPTQEMHEASAPSSRHISAEAVPMGPPPPPPKPKSSQDTAFMEELHAVDEELASVSTEPFEPLAESLIACRTRSKRTLKDVPIGQLEAELCAPDATPDMYEPNTADDEEWKLWLQGLMSGDMGNEVIQQT